MDDTTARLIMRIGAKVGASKYTVSKWPVRGVSFRWRLPIIRQAALEGVTLSEADFEAPAMKLARAA